MESHGQLVWRHPPWKPCWKRQAGPKGKALEGCPGELQRNFVGAPFCGGANLPS